MKCKKSLTSYLLALGLFFNFSPVVYAGTVDGTNLSENELVLELVSSKNSKNIPVSKAYDITFTDTDIYVDGKQINLQWEYFDREDFGEGYYVRNELTSLNMKDTSRLGTVYSLSFEGFNKYIENALLIEVSNVGFWDHLERFGDIEEPVGEPERDRWIYTYQGSDQDYGVFIYNLDTGKIEDNLGSYPYKYQGFKAGFEFTGIIKW